jgi:hypothetical protein
MDAICDRHQPGNQLIAVPDLLALFQRDLETAGCGEPAATCPAEPVKRLIGAASYLGEVQNRFLDPGPRREQDGMTSFGDAAGSVDDHVCGAANAPIGRYRDMNYAADPVGEAIQFSRCLVAENGIGARSQQSCPE